MTQILAALHWLTVSFRIDFKILLLLSIFVIYDFLMSLIAA